MRPMPLRYKFGVKLGSVHLKRPAVLGELPDLEIVPCFGDEITPGPNGTLSVPVVFPIPAYTPGVTHNRLVSVHAVAVPKGAAEPTDPEAAVNSTLPQASADASDHTGGGDLVVTLDGLPEGTVTVLTVFAFQDEPAPPPGPTDGPQLDTPPAPPAPSEPTEAVAPAADPSAAAGEVAPDPSAPAAVAGV